MLAGVETGGTKTICAVADAPDAVIDKLEIPTCTPMEVFAQINSFLARFLPIKAIGIGAFGPVGVDPASAAYGAVLNTPKPGWAGFSYLDALSQHGAPVIVQNDVSAACLGEYVYGAGRGCGALAYVTVGTGIGAGIVHEGRILRGAGHYEMGHIRTPHDRQRDPFEGCCPFHSDCLEGLASGRAIKERWGADLSQLGEDAAQLTADYLAHLANVITLTHAPHRIIFGGGVMKTPGLMNLVRASTENLLAGYLDGAGMSKSMEKYIVSPELNDDSGVVGALTLAARAAAP